MLLQRLVTLLVWLLVGWTAMALALRLLPGNAGLPPGAQALAPEAPPPADLTRLFGAAPAPAAEAAAPPPPPESSRFRLIGVVAPKQPAEQSKQGVALLAIDGGPPRAYRVGQRVEGEWTLLSVEPRGAGLGTQGQVTLQLPLAELPPAATGLLPGVGANATVPMPAHGAAQMPPPMQQPAMPPVEAAAPQAGDDEAGPRRPPTRGVSLPQTR